MITILKFIIDVTALLATVSIVLGVSLAFAKKVKQTWVLFSFYGLGILAGIAEFFYGQSDPKGTNIALIRFNRQLMLGLCALMLLSFLCLVVFTLLKKQNKALASVINVLIGMVGGAYFLYVMPQLLKLATTFVFYGETGFGTLALMRLIGYVLGIVACFVLGLCLCKVFDLFHPKQNKALTTLTFGLLSLQHLVLAVPALQRLKLVQTTDSFLGISIFDIMVFEDNHGVWMVYALAVVLALIALVLWIKHIGIKGEFKNSALRRLEIARRKVAKRWALACLAFLVYLPFCLSFLQYQATKPPTQTLPEDYSVVENKIVIDTQTLSDGKLHKYKYTTPNGVDVVFLAVKKPSGGAYGLGLDACDICGTAGYFERGNDVVCARCDVVMNKNTIGFKGGCNPIPFPYTLQNSNIYIEKADLETLEKKFR